MSSRLPIAIEPGARLGSALHISWALHNLCNYRCSYCHKGNWDGSDRWLNFDRIVMFLERVFEHYKKEIYVIAFTGGEPTLWPDFAKLCKFLKSRGCYVGLTSNGSRPVQYWESIAESLDWACLSYHAEFARDEEFLAVVKLLKSKPNLLGSARLMMNPKAELWQRAINMGNAIKAQVDPGIFFYDYVPLDDNFGSSSGLVHYEPWQNEVFAGPTRFETGKLLEAAKTDRLNVWEYFVRYDDGTREPLVVPDLIAHSQVNFKGWTCYIGVDQLYIKPQGEVLPAGCGQGPPIGQIFDEQLAFPASPVQCGKSFCSCGIDIQTRKRRDFDKAP